MTDQPCTRCGAPAEPAARPICALCAVQLLIPAQVEERIAALGESGGLDAIMDANFGGVRYVDAVEAAANDARVAGKCAMVRAVPGGRLGRCGMPAARETADGDRCCERCWSDRGQR